MARTRKPATLASRPKAPPVTQSGRAWSTGWSHPSDAPVPLTLKPKTLPWAQF